MKRRLGKYNSWGNLKPDITDVYVLPSDNPDLSAIKNKWLPHGLGRSYGDSCLLTDGDMVLSDDLRRFRSFDAENGILCVEAGVSLGEILSVISPRGWFLPVLPGTQFVTVGGAIANDIHSKNHHRKGSFGCHIKRFMLLRSDTGIIECSEHKNPELFKASIGGLGLSGMILWAEIKLMKIANPDIDVEEIPFSGISEFASLAEESNRSHEYTVAWIDCLGRGANLGRGIFMRGNHAETTEKNAKVSKRGSKGTRSLLSVPFHAPDALLNSLTMGLFNSAYYHKNFGRSVVKRSAYQSFFFPLDSILNWNRLYGKRGFYQYQLLIPGDDYTSAIEEVLKMVVSSGQGTFLSVLKTFGDIPSPGILSFPRAGATLTLDFPNKDESVLRLMDRLDEHVKAHHGSVYPAKDARMSSDSFVSFFPKHTEFRKYLDPKCSSDFWKRVNTRKQ